MLKSGDFSEAARLFAFRRKLVEDRGLLQHAMGVTIRGSYQDEDMLNACRPAAQAELKRRIDAVDQELIELGVDMSDAPPLED